MPAGTLQGEGFDPDELIRIARTAARVWRDFTPLGGVGWSPEDLAWAVSVLYEETRTGRFERALRRAASVRQVRNYLLKALYHRLLKRAARLRRIGLLDGLRMDALPAAGSVGRALDPMDRGTLVDRALAALTSAERETAGAYFGGFPVRADLRAPSERTCKRHRARLRTVVQEIVHSQGLTREEAQEFIASLAATITRHEGPRAGSENPWPHPDLPGSDQVNSAT